LRPIILGGVPIARLKVIAALSDRLRYEFDEGRGQDPFHIESADSHVGPGREKLLNSAIPKMNCSSPFGARNSHLRQSV
jgi:hypothetical protein